MRTLWLRVALWLLAASAVAASALPAMGQGLVPFTEEAAARGVNYMMQPYPQTTGLYGFGCGFADLDGDGDQDIIMLGAAGGIVGLFENDGTGHFIKPHRQQRHRIDRPGQRFSRPRISMTMA